jgi:hypothetical protein
MLDTASNLVLFSPSNVTTSSVQVRNPGLDKVVAEFRSDGQSTLSNLVVTGSSTLSNLVVTGSITQSNAPVVAPVGHAMVVDHKPGGTHGGNMNVGWNRRNLNTILFDTNSNVLGLTGDQVWVAKGTYKATFSTPIWEACVVKTRLFNTTTSTDLGYTQAAGGSPWDDAIACAATGTTAFTIATASNALELHMYSSKSNWTGIGLGLAVNLGVPEQYSSLILEKIG